MSRIRTLFTKASCPGPQRLASGFTLVEMLVAMSLLSLIVLGLAGAMGTMGRTETSIDNRLERMDESRASTDFLRAVLGRISAKRVQGLQQQGMLSAAPSAFFFEGAGQSMTWVGVMPARYGVGGRYHFRLAMGSYDGAPAVILSYLPWIDQQTLPEWGAAQTYPLLQHATGLSFQYLNGGIDPPQWGSDWGVVDQLPQAVQVVMTTETSVLAPVVVQLRVMPAGDPRGSGGGASLGGSTG
ncbi:prepilin-type N-terminal cleavage/methylation domain-containing protein [Comamonas piscis]|uniref:Prepilin-type N-terminal cleavage/methylation domain-containing protein n=1 Tax=Comamonas piscis TaxID=1562974 RepID=A0A7G5EN03_9BURK|nr:prepilin-type N-terminal cleavage/methylation domain-containing protein [Comamonas piscis]QMV75378.1 prepilin-type N-terminal cleavage/methylation domain-containing protein [Comamonas piscis]WSO33879.1 prepilin-type N-terminal cleavage/methylation domain-containing protein [Comamonas piscis]